MTASLSPIPDNDSEKQEIDDENLHLDSTKHKHESILTHTHKTVGKVKFGRTSMINQSQKTLLPKLTNLNNESSADSLRKMPKIVRKILEKKMNLDPIYMKSIDKEEDDENVTFLLLF